ncbi:hypothetical protein EJB05_57103, partial [Eragrostis curvula]
MALARSSFEALVHQRQPKPFTERQLFTLDFHGNASDDDATLALTRYDVSLAGFANRTGHWYAFPGYQHRIPVTSTLLPFGNSYQDLIGGLENVPSLLLDHAAWQHAVHVLSAATGNGDDVEELKRALATLKVTTSETTRLKPIRKAVFAGLTIAAEHLPYIEHWYTICSEIHRAEKNGGVWDGPFTELLRERANIHSMEEALHIVHATVNCTMEDLLAAPDHVKLCSLLRR